MGLKIIEHPLILDKLTRMRRRNTPCKVFKESMHEITNLMAYDIFNDLQVKSISIETPVTKATGYEINENIVLVPILRAGLGMVDGFANLVPNAKIGHIGLYRDEKTMQPKEYFIKKPKNAEGSYILILDPMLATGGSALLALKKVQSWKPRQIKLVCLLAAPEGLKRVMDEYPEVDIYLASKDEKLDENGYIIPGLGDAGDRYFGTE